MSQCNTSQQLFHLLCAPLLAFLAQSAQSHNADHRTHKFLEVRMVVYRDLDCKDCHYTITRFYICATKVVELYLHRWEIEAFFGWIKRHLELGHWYSENENGVLI